MNKLRLLGMFYACVIALVLPVQAQAVIGMAGR